MVMLPSVMDPVPKIVSDIYWHRDGKDEFIKKKK